jgi:hypothetical protein
MTITQLGTLVFYGTFATGAIPAAIIAVAAVGALTWQIRKADAARNRMMTPAFGKE